MNHPSKSGPRSPKLSTVGKDLLNILISKYQMNEESARRLINDYDKFLFLAFMSKKR